MTQNLKIEVLTGDISIDGMVVTNLVTKEELSTTIVKKADLGADGKIPTSQLPAEIVNTAGIVDEVKLQLETSIKDAVDESNAYAESYTDNALSSKADLTSGKVPLEQLPAIDQYPQFGTALSNLSTSILTSVKQRTDQLEKSKADLGEDGKVLREQIPSYEKISGLPEQFEVMLNHTAAVSGELDQHKLQTADRIDTLKENIEANVQQLTDRQSHLMRTYATKELGVDAKVGVKPGEYFYVRSANEEEMLVEYQNVGGSAVATGKSYLSSLGVQLQEKAASTIIDESGKTQQQINDFNKSIYRHIKDYGAIADGQPHKLSEKFTTLAQAQFVFPNVTITSLNQSLDYAALAQAIYALNAQGGGTLNAQNLALVATDTNLVATIEQQGQRIDMKSNVILDFKGSTLKDFIPIFLNCDDAWIYGGKFVDTASTAQTLKRYAFTIRSSKRCGFKNGTTFYRTPGLGNNSVGYLYSYMISDGVGGWTEGTGNLERVNEDILFDKIMIYGYGQIQQIGGYNTIYDGVIYKQGVGDDGICFKTYMYDDGKGSGAINGAVINNCWAEGAGSLFSIGGAVHTNFPISNITCVGGGGKDLQSLALIRSCGDTTDNPSRNSYGGTVSDISISGCTMSGLNTRALIAFWLSHAGVVKNINVSNITATMRTGLYLGSRKGAYLMQLLDRHGTSNSTLDNVNFNNIQISSGHETIYKNKLASTYGLGGLIDEVSNIGNKKNIRFDDISLDGCHVNGSEFLVSADQNISAGRIFVKLETGATTLGGSYKYIGRNMPIDKLILDSNNFGRIALTNLVAYAYAGANYFPTKQFIVNIPLTETNGTFDFVMPALENMYLLRAKARMVSTLTANASNYLTMRLHTNPLVGSYVDIFKTDVNNLDSSGKTVFTDNVQTYNQGNIWTFKQGDLFRLQGLVTGTVAQQKGLVIVFEYLSVDYK